MIVSERITDQLSVTLEFEDHLDTCVTFNGFVWIAGQDREDFLRDLEALVGRYRI